MNRKILSLSLFFVLLTGSYLTAQKPVSGSIKDWMVLGPFPVGENAMPDEKIQKEAFQADLIDPASVGQIKEGQAITIAGKELKWKKAAVNDKGYLDLDTAFNKPDFVYAYALAEIESPEAATRLIGIGSDDAVKVWLNGEQIHEFWGGRGYRQNEDLLEVHFRKGRNLLLFKVQDMQYDWGVSCTLLAKEELNELLLAAASAGQIDQANLLLRYGADARAQVWGLLQPLHVARLKGRKEMAELLIKSGFDANVPMPSREKLIEDRLREVTKGVNPGVAVLVARDGKILYQKGFGYENLEKKIPVTTESKFRIGSITKQFTAAAILKLQEEGKINVNDKLSKYLPGFPRGEEVTIHQLLTHTSGIHSYTNQPDFVDRVTKPVTEKQLIEEIKAYPYDFNPGESWSYNNSAFLILGYLVEQLSGKSFNDYLVSTFFKPLGMQNTAIYRKGLNLKNEALGYSYENGKVELAKDWDMSWAGGAGALYSTVGDLYRWNEAVFNGKVLKPASTEAAFTPVKLKDGSVATSFGSGGYGYGWAIASFREQQEIAHGGGLHGFVTYLARLPEKKLTIAVLTNAAPPQYIDPASLTNDLVEIFLWEELPAQASFATTKMEVTALRDYLGAYEYPGGAILQVTQDGNRLMARLTGQPTFEIFSKGKDEFFWKVVEASVKFKRDETGKVTHVVHSQAGRTFEAPRFDPPKAVKVDPALYDRYAGDYVLGPVTVSIKREGDKLFADVAGQPTMELLPSSETEFFLDMAKVTFSFHVDGSGKVVSVTIDQGGVKQVATRK